MRGRWMDESKRKEIFFFWDTKSLRMLLFPRVVCYFIFATILHVFFLHPPQLLCYILFISSYIMCYVYTFSFIVLIVYVFIIHPLTHSLTHLLTYLLICSTICILLNKYIKPTFTSTHLDWVHSISYDKKWKHHKLS